jgi:hypothetical protein
MPQWHVYLTLFFPEFLGFFFLQTAEAIQMDISYFIFSVKDEKINILPTVLQ